MDILASVSVGHTHISGTVQLTDVVFVGKVNKKKHQN